MTTCRFFDTCSREDCECYDTASRVDATDPSWYPLFLKELESTHPDVYQEVTSAVIVRNAERQVAAKRDE